VFVPALAARPAALLSRQPYLSTRARARAGDAIGAAGRQIFLFAFYSFAFSFLLEIARATRSIGEVGGRSIALSMPGGGFLNEERKLKASDTSRPWP
jgi:hypothetical protein